MSVMDRVATRTTLRSAVGPVALAGECWLYTSARRYRAMGTGAGPT